ncbi:MAG: ATP-binding cassette domain-containing protein [Evtepia gabavorous]
MGSSKRRPRQRRKNYTSVGISEEQHQRYPANLSGGEQQRVAIARALSSGAGIILADEPTGNLDTANGNQVMEILLRLAHEEGRCVIVVTHDMDIAAQADEVWRMKDGALALEA